MTRVPRVKLVNTTSAFALAQRFRDLFLRFNAPLATPSTNERPLSRSRRLTSKSNPEPKVTAETDFLPSEHSTVAESSTTRRIAAAEYGHGVLKLNIEGLSRGMAESLLDPTQRFLSSHERMNAELEMVQQRRDRYGGTGGVMEVYLFSMG